MHAKTMQDLVLGSRLTKILVWVSSPPRPGVKHVWGGRLIFISIATTSGNRSVGFQTRGVGNLESWRDDINNSEGRAQQTPIEDAS